MKNVCTLAEHIIDSSLDIIIAVDNRRNIVEFNKAAQSAFGYSKEEILGSNVGIIYADPKQGIEVSNAVLQTGRFIGEVTNIRKDGVTFSCFLSATYIRDPAGNIQGVFGISRDVTEFKKAEESLHSSLRFLSTMFDSIKDPFSIIDRNYRIVRVNEAYAQLKNLKVEELTGRICHEVLQNKGAVCDGCIVKKTFDSADPCAKEKKFSLPDGTEAWVDIYTYPVVNDEGDVSHVIEYTRDITDRKRTEQERDRLIEKLEYLSSTDALSGLSNRRALIDRLNYEADRACRYDSELALLLCDIDRFKEINDTYGHENGDRVIQAVADVLAGALRKADIVGRFGGDEFMLILPETSLQGAEDFAERLRSKVEHLRVPGESGPDLSVSMSIGVTFFPLQTIPNVAAVIKCADTALYASKRTGRNKVCVVRP